jgi:hypothetical protein
MREALAAPAMRAAWQKQPPEPAWRQASGILRSPDLIAVLVLCAVGLLASVCAAFFLPSFIEIVAAL